MILTDGSIQQAMASGNLVIEPLQEAQVGPASVDLRLGTTFLRPKQPPEGVFSMSDEVAYEIEEGQAFIIPTRGFVLATTVERIKLGPELSAFVEGRSSVGRLGLFIQNAGWVDPGFEGMITLELYNANDAPMRIEAGRRICQLVIARADAPAIKPYAGKYQGQGNTTGSRIHLDAECGRGPSA